MEGELAVKTNNNKKVKGRQGQTWTGNFRVQTSGLYKIMPGQNVDTANLHCGDGTGGLQQFQNVFYFLLLQVCPSMIVLYNSTFPLFNGARFDCYK